MYRSARRTLRNSMKPSSCNVLPNLYIGFPPYLTTTSEILALTGYLGTDLHNTLWVVHNDSLSCVELDYVKVPEDARQKCKLEEIGVRSREFAVDICHELRLIDGISSKDLGFRSQPFLNLTPKLQGAQNDCCKNIWRPSSLAKGTSTCIGNLQANQRFS